MKLQQTIARVALLHPKFIPHVTSFINDAEAVLGISLLLVQGLRTFAQQQDIWDQGRTAPGNIVTNAKPGQSYHNYGIAVDLVPDNNGALDWHYDFSKLVPYAAKYFLTWGGNFPAPDEDHFEDKFGYSWQQLLAKYNAMDFIPGTQFVNL